MNDILDKFENTDFNSDFKTALLMSEQNYSYSQWIEFLKSGSDVERQFAALELTEVKSKGDALVLTSNLVGQDGKIREAVAFKIGEFINSDTYLSFFLGNEFFEILLQGLLDINGNVCRAVVSFIQISEFKAFLVKKLPDCIAETLNHIENLSKDEKQYKISKRNFQLYWCLEALFTIIDEINAKDVFESLSKTAEFEDYTIREKTSKILSKIKDVQFMQLKEILKNDSNYYVKRYLV